MLVSKAAAWTMESLQDGRFATAVEDGSRFKPDSATRVTASRRFVTEFAARIHTSMNTSFGPSAKIVLSSWEFDIVMMSSTYGHAI
jgi:hypothetical protein